MKKCPICQDRETGTKKSHIIPKMFRNKLGGPKSNIKIKRIQPSENLSSQDRRTYQDIPKEKGLLCDECEHNLSVLESYYGLKIYSVIQNNNYSKKYRSKIGISKKWKEIDEVDMKIISLFYQSILLRQHISNIDAYKEFTLDKDLAEMIRKQLSYILADTPDQMVNNMNDLEDELHFMPFLNWTVNKANQGDNFLGAIPQQSGKFLLMLNDIRVILVDDMETVKKNKLAYSKLESNTLKMEVKSKQKWSKESESIVMNIDSYLSSI